MSGEHVNAVLAALGSGECRTIDVLAEILPLTRAQVSSACARLISRALVVRIETGCFRATGDGLVALARGVDIKSGPRGPRPAGAPARRVRHVTQRDRLWQAMRIKGKFSVPELLELAGGSAANAQRYLARLARAGYLLELPRRGAGTAPTSNGFKRWALIRDTGPLAPLWRPRLRQVFDPNLPAAGAA